MHVNAHYQTLRRLLGQLGILLPVILYIVHGFKLESSISHFYYTEAGTVFSGILISFGLFLFTYRGHDKNKIPSKKEWISDNGLTNIGGFLAIFTGLVPTSFGSDLQNSCNHPLCHNNGYIGTFHLICAAGFLGVMGGMTIFKFTMSPKEGNEWRHMLFKVTGYLVWASIVFMAVYIYLRNQGHEWFPNGVFWGETVASISFGTAWLVKGHPSQMWIMNQVSKAKGKLA